MNYRTKTIVYIGISLFIQSIVFIIGTYIGSKHGPVFAKTEEGTENTLPKDLSIDFAPFWDAWNILEEKYPDQNTTTNEEKLWGAISGLVASYDDPYTVFFPPEESKSFNESINGEFDGVGMEVGIKDKILTVIAPIKDTPAFNAGIKSGDRILKIDETESNGLTLDSAINLIRGKKGTIVKLLVVREGENEAKEYSIIRDTISLPSLETESRDDGIFIIRLYNFSAKSPGLFRDAMFELKKKDTDKLILDLRGNPGGYLEASVDIASWFLEKGKPVVIESFGNTKIEETYRSKGYATLFGKKLKVIILVDGGSASASEILAGALHDHNIATLVGTTTFGKGSVQELIKLTSQTSLKITIAKWFTPNRVSISDEGIDPDVLVEITPETKKGVDPQLEKAVELLLKK